METKQYKLEDLGIGNDAVKEGPPRTKLTFLRDRPFTITSIEDSRPFKDALDEPVITVTTEEEFDCVNKAGDKLGKFSCFYATKWKVVMEQLNNENLRAALKEGGKIPKMRIEQRSTKSGGSKYYVLAPAAE